MTFHSRTVLFTDGFAVSLKTFCNSTSTTILNISVEIFLSDLL